MTECRTIGVSIARGPDQVHDFLANPENFPRWSEFITAIKPAGNGWLATTPQGQVRMRFMPPNEFRVLDHWVEVNDTLTVHMPVRVLPNGEGSEVIFSVFRLAGLTDQQFEDDVGMVRRDLASLKRVLENQ
jgi:hypothetical protein